MDSPIQRLNEYKDLTQNNKDLVPPFIQEQMFHIEKQVEFDGIEMGVLENGIPYLSENGLARMCGIDRKGLNRLASNWEEEKNKDRGTTINRILEESGYYEKILYLKSEQNGIIINAYTEPVCLALLEYYAFLAKEKREEAITAFRILAKKTFRAFIYQAVGYSPEQSLLDSWKHFHDRVDMLLDAVPLGYFSIFTEIASMIVPMIRSGIMISDKVVPDISVGKTWGTYWEEKNFSKIYGDRIKYNHEYPLYYPQANSNPQSAFAYPDSALGEFRTWLRQNYIMTKFPKYLISQAKQGKLGLETAKKMIDVFSAKKIE